MLEDYPVDQRTQVLVVRPDAPAAACRDFERRLLGHRLEGRATLVVDPAGADRLSGAMIAALLRAQRKIGLRSGRVVVTAERPEIKHAVECAGLEVAEPVDTAAGREPR